jgi:hypothetical protein
LALLQEAGGKLGDPSVTNAEKTAALEQLRPVLERNARFLDDSVQQLTPRKEDDEFAGWSVR